MSEETDRDILIRMAQKLEDHVGRYERDRNEAMTRIAGEKREQKEFRDGIVERVDDLKNQIAPVVADHNRVKWAMRATGAGLITAAGAWIWDTLRTHLKP